MTELSGRVEHCDTALNVEHRSFTWEGPPGDGIEVENVTMKPCPSCDARVTIHVETPA